MFINSSKVSKLGSILTGAPGMAYRLGRRLAGVPCLPELYYIVPNANWVIDWVGHYITSNINSQFNWPTHITSAPYTLVDHIIHYGDLWSFLASLKFHHNAYNTIVATIFHGNRTGEFPELAEAIDRLLEHKDVTDRVVTASRIMEQRLTSWGIAPNKVTCIPLGIDLSHFKPASELQRLASRRKIGVPDDVICIGSFQKDGSGWQEGMTPKLIKGPDIFLQVIERLHNHYNLYVLLTAPARGYVKQGLEKLGVPYKHDIVSNYQNIVSYYHCLDLYLITSREEGGPKAVLESLACGVPLVSTKVGLAPDVVQHGYNGLLANPEDMDTLAELSAQAIEQPDLRHRLVTNGLESIFSYDWQSIAVRYYQEVYLPLLNKLCQ